MRKSVISLFLLLISLASSAQFRVVDAEDGNPLEYVYVYSSTGKVLGMSGKNGQVAKYQGKVTLSLMGYEQKIVDADTCRSDVRLKAVDNLLNEVVVGSNDYIKRTCAFRDVFRNNDSIVLYREGLVDYYYNIKTKSLKRRISACRQYEHPKLRSLWGNYPVLFNTKSINLAHVRHLDHSDVISQNGDTTLYNASFMGLKSDAMMTIADTVHNRYRTIIDMKKFRDDVAPMNTKVNNLLHLRWEADIIDWTYNDKETSTSSLVSCRHYRRISNGKKKKPVLEETTLEMYVISQEAMSKEQAKQEMDDKTETQDFDTPNCMPPAPFDVKLQTQRLVLRGFWDSY